VPPGPRRAPLATSSPSICDHRPSNARRSRCRLDAFPRSGRLPVTHQNEPRLGCPAHSQKEDEGYVGDRRHPPRFGPRRRRPHRDATSATATPGEKGTAGPPSPRSYERHEDGMAADAGAGHRCRLFTTREGP